MGIRSTQNERNIQARKSSVPTIGKGKPLDARGNEGDLTFRRTSEGLKLYIKANHKWHGIKVGESFDLLEKRINEMKSKVDTIKQFRLPSTYSVTGDFTLDVSGDIQLNADGGQVDIGDDTARHFRFDCDNTSLTIYDDANEADYFRIGVDANGATRFITNDNDGASGNLTLDVDGAVSIESKGALTLNCDDRINIDMTDRCVFQNGGQAFGEIRVDTVSQLVLYEQGGASQDDYFQISTATHGATTITTVDAASGLGAGVAADLTLDIDGDIKYEANGSEPLAYGTHDFYGGAHKWVTISGTSLASFLSLYNPADTGDYFKIFVGNHGATTISTLDNAIGGNAAHLTLDPLGEINLTPRTEVKSDTPLKIKEKASAVADTATYGQLWVKTATPNELYFTTDDGDDIQLTSGTSTAGGGGTDTYCFSCTAKCRTQYNNWYYPNTAYGISYYYWLTTLSSTSLATSWYDSYVPGWIVPRDGEVKSYTIIGNISTTDTWEWAILKGTGVTPGSAGNWTLSNVGATQSAGGTANIIYKWEQTGLSTSVSAGDMLLPAFRRTTDNDSSYSYCEMGLSIIME